jgi:hypothetical protein
MGPRAGRSDDLQDGAPAGGGGAGEVFRPVFIVGCERSGTTLLAVVLDRHSEMAVTPETHFCIKVGRRGAGDHERWLERFYGWQRTAALGLGRAELEARFRQGPADAANLLRAALEEYARRHGKVRVGEKTPFHLYHVPRLLEWYPEARVVCIVRDGRDVVLSILRAPWTPHQMMREHCRKWLRAVRYGEELQRRHGERVLQVRFEDLIAQPEAVTRRIDEFVGLAFEPGQLAPSGSSDTIPVRERPWKAKAEEAFDASRIGDWARRATPAQRRVMNGMMSPTLRHLGYPDTAPVRCSWPVRAADAVANTACRMGLYRLFYRMVLRHLPSGRAHRRDGETRRPAASGRISADEG